MGVYKVGNIWYIDYYCEGRRVREPASKRKAEAEEMLEARKTDIKRGEFRLPGKRKIKFEKFAQEYMEYAKLNKRSWMRDEISLKHLLPHFKGMPLLKINPKHIEDYKRKRLDKVKPATINRELTLLKFMFSLAKKWKYANENPVKEVKFFQERQLVIHTLTKEEALKLIAVAGEHLKPIIMLALNTGMRRGEILNLRWNDVDFDRRFIYIKETKSGVMRKVPMNSLVIEALSKLERKNSFVFQNPKTNERLKHIRTAFYTARRKAGIEDFRFHDLRHTAATWMVAEGIDLVTVKEILGHADIKTTMRYAHPTPENKRKAVDALAGVLSEKVVTIRSYEEKRQDVNDLLSNN